MYGDEEENDATSNQIVEKKEFKERDVPGTASYGEEEGEGEGWDDYGSERDEYQVFDELSSKLDKKKSSYGLDKK